MQGMSNDAIHDEHMSNCFWGLSISQETKVIFLYVKLLGWRSLVSTFSQFDITLEGVWDDWFMIDQPLFSEVRLCLNQRTLEPKQDTFCILIAMTSFVVGGRSL